MRTCRKCGMDETQVEFYPADTTSGRSAGRCCKSCWVSSAVEWRNNNRVRWNRSRHKRNIMRTHGLTSEQYEELFADPKCAVCGSTDSVALDHDHRTNRIRGLLCRNCNLALGNAKDDPAVLLGLVEYLNNAVAEGQAPQGARQ